MSMFSTAPGTVPSDTMVDDLMKHSRPFVEGEIAGMANLMAHPIAGATAMTALGIGVASHAVGVWFGLLSGAMENSRRLFMPFVEEAFGEPKVLQPGDMAKEAPQADTPAAPSNLITLTKARAAAKELKRATKGGRIEAAPSPALEQPKAPEPAVRIVEKPLPAPAMAAEPAVEATAVAAGVAQAELFSAAVGAADSAPRESASADKPTAADDLKKIGGVGPKLEQVLNAQGIWTYAQIAGWGEAEIERIEGLLGFKGRITRDDWIGQAASLLEQASAKQS